jgi:hypothetical protein
MKITRVSANNRKKAFEVSTRSQSFRFPYAVAEPSPTATEKVASVWVDEELGKEGFTYRLDSGREGTIHIDHVLEYNRDPATMANLLLYKLTLEAQRRVEASPLTTREIIRRLDTSAAQFYRLLDQTNTQKSLKQLVSLLAILDCEVDLVVRDRRSA